MDNHPDTLTQTPNAERLHIVIFGRRNVGKSSLINAITGQQVAITSDTPGTTTDPVNKAMEIYPLGPCLLTDTAGYDDTGELGALRNKRTQQAIAQAHLALIVIDQEPQDLDQAWMDALKSHHIPYLVVLNKSDLLDAAQIAAVEKKTGAKIIAVSALKHEGIEALRLKMASLLPHDEARSITGSLAQAGDVVLLVMPQDQQAPKGRLILPQVQTIRDLLDKNCTVVSATAQGLPSALNALSKPPRLIIADSQVFGQVYAQKPAESLLTSFSVLMAAYKGDIAYMVQSAKRIDQLHKRSKILIAEACTHAPLSEDIGRKKIPALLKKRYGVSDVTVTSGKDFPDDLSAYDLVIHCGACMFTRRLMLARTRQAIEQQVPMTNYGLAIAHLKGILDKVVIP